MPRRRLHNLRHWPVRVLILSAIALALACASEIPTPTPPAVTNLPSAKAAFWDCVLTWQRRYQEANTFQRALALNSEIFQSQSAASQCQEHLPGYAEPLQEPAIAGAAVSDCLDQEKDLYQAAYPRGPDPGTNDFILQALNKICYTAERRPDYGFATPQP